MAETARVSPFAIFRNRNFSLMWSGQLVSTMGSALTSLAASIYVFRLTNSALSVGLMLMATAAPSLLVGLFAGVFVDRYDRKKIMIAERRAAGASWSCWCRSWCRMSVIWLYIIVILTSAIGQFFDPAHESVLPEVASEEELASAEFADRHQLVRLHGHRLRGLGADRLGGQHRLGVLPGRRFLPDLGAAASC